MKKVGLLLVLMMSAVLLAMITALVIKIFGSGAEFKLPERPAVEEEAGEAPEEAPQEEIPAEAVAEESAPEEEVVSEQAEEEVQSEGENPEAAEELPVPEEEEPPEEEKDELSEEQKQELIDKSADFSLKKMKNDVWSGNIRLTDGGRAGAVIPIMNDPDSGDELLCDGYRKIICVEDSEGELKPYAIKGDASEDGAAMEKYFGLIEICDMLAAAGWKKEGEETTLPPEYKDILDNTVLPASRLVYVGNNEGRYIFKFSADTQEDSDYEELYTLISEIYRDPGNLEYIFERVYMEKVLPGAKGGVAFKALRKKNITLNNAKAAGKEVLKAGDSLKVFFSDDTIEKMKPKFGSGAETRKIKKEELKSFEKSLIYEDSNILIVNKDAGILSQQDSSGDLSLNDLLAFYLENEVKHYAVKPAVCNRLDRNTSGIVLCGKTQKGLKGLSEIIKNRSLKKYYYAIVFGEVQDKLHLKGYLHKDSKENKAVITDEKPEGDSDAVETIAEPTGKIKIKDCVMTLMKVELITGKPHQIRAHMLHAGFPVMGDIKYCTGKSLEASEKLGIKRQMLHAFKVQFPKIKGDLSALSGKVFEAPVKDDMNALLKYR